ncbi:MAG: UbiA family prenyltransferase [Pseudomonadota bacterium]
MQDPSVSAGARPTGEGRATRRHPWLRLLRLHHWLKNALLGVPFLTAQAWARPGALSALGLGFLSLSLLASATYVLNDLADLAHDREHAQKRHRPLASGEIGERAALTVAALCALVGIALAWLVGAEFFATMLVYVVLTTLYTRGLKRQALVDVLALAALWTLRLVAGAAAIQVALSAWLLSFGAFLFMSLSLAKRVAELEAFGGDRDRSLPGRGYARRDLPALLAFGISTGVVSVLVLALFVDSTPAHLKYPHHERLWLVCPAVWFWLARIWLETSRGQMHHDPLVYSLRDRASWCVVAIIALVWAAALTPLGP